jgi:predicted dehydrogenase
MAICDVNEESDYSRFYYRGTAGRKPALELIEKRYARRKSAGEYKGCASYVDFRKMLEKEKAIDAVLVATPDHIHAVATMAAIKNGKHVYCEKPLTHSVYETRKIAEAARQAKVATQMGNQGHSGEGIRLTVEWIRDGAIGDVREVHSWSHTGGGWAEGRTARPKETPPAPSGLNWNLWLGPVPHRPYHLAYAPYNWRGWWDFGTGANGDMACHNMAPAFWALDLGHPVSVEGSSSGINYETTPLTSIIHWQFAARKNMPPVKVTWYGGGLMPPQPDELEPGRKLTGGGNGILFVGDKGKIMCPGWGGNPRIIPETRMKAYERPAKTIPRSKGHHRDWIDACKGGKPASSNFDYAGPMTEVILLGNVALRTGKKLTWDGPNMKATNAPEADKYICPEYHNGWTL